MRSLFVALWSLSLLSPMSAAAEDHMCAGVLDYQTVVTQLSPDQVSVDGAIIPGVRWTPIFAARPVYEKRSLRDLKGHVVFLLNVQANGGVKDVRFVSAKPKKLYTKRSKKDAKRLHFIAPKVDGKPIAVSHVCYVMEFD